MFNLFKRKKEITKWYADLPPGERIANLFEEKAEHVLSHHGYKYLRSRLCFKRKIGQLTHEISVSKDKWNKGDEVCSFWLVFTIYADTYNDWHIEKYGTPPLNNVVTGFYHNHLKNWKTQYPLDKYDLSTQDNKEVFEEITDNLENLVLPMLDDYSGYEAAANTLMRERQYWMAAKIYDFYLMACNPAKANDALHEGKEFFAKQPDPQKEFLDAFQVRLQKL